MLPGRLKHPIQRDGPCQVWCFFFLPTDPLDRIVTYQETLNQKTSYRETFHNPGHILQPRRHPTTEAISGGHPDLR